MIFTTHLWGQNNKSYCKKEKKSYCKWLQAEGLIGIYIRSNNSARVEPLFIKIIQISGMMTGPVANAYFPPTCWDQLLWRRHWPSLWKQRLQAACPEPPWWGDWALWSSLTGTQTHTHTAHKGTQKQKKPLNTHRESGDFFGKSRSEYSVCNPNNSTLILRTPWMKWAMTHLKKKTHCDDIKHDNK